MIEVNSFAELCTTAPTKNGDMAFLRCYNADSNFRGGDFTGFIGTTTTADYGGTLAVGNGFYWKCVNDPADLNVYHFGAKGDGYANDTDAFNRMLTWTQKYSGNIRDLPVRFLGG